MNWPLTLNDLCSLGYESRGDGGNRERGQAQPGIVGPVTPNSRLPKGGQHATLFQIEPLRIPRDQDEGVKAGHGATSANEAMSKTITDDEFVELVDAHYEALYRFAFSLTHAEADARDLVQDTFMKLARKGGQLRTRSKAKSWLFTTLYRAFIDAHRHQVRHPQVEMEAAEPELPTTEPVAGDQLDSATVQEALARVDEVFRIPLILFYLEQHSYLEIAEILSIPPGTVMSRISRGRAMLRRMLNERPNVPAAGALAKIAGAGCGGVVP